MENRIFIVEDDAAICEMVTAYLASEQFETDVCNNGSAAIRTFSADPGRYALALIDLMLPGAGGMEVIRAIRAVSTVPVIILTARDNDTDKTMGLNLGADDYVVKPFSLIELTARIRANIRRATSYGVPAADDRIHVRDLELQLTSRQATLAGNMLTLTRTEFDLLALFASHPGQAFSKEQLYDRIWKEPYYGNEHVLNTHINWLRAKLKAADPDNSYIKTLWGIGYKMEDR